MKKIIFSVFAVFAAIILFSSCNKDSLKLDVPFTAPKIKFALDSAALSGAKGEELLYTEVLKVDIDSILKANEAGSIDDVKLKEAILGLVSTSGIDLDWLQSTRITVQSKDVAETEIANYPQVGIDQQSLTLNVAGLDLKNQFSNKDITIRIYGMLNGPIPANTAEMQLDLKFILGVLLK